MSKHQPEPPRVGWPLWMKIVVSLAIVWHFFAISLAITSEGGDNAPRLCRNIYYQELGRVPAYPYLRFLFLTNAYRFFAPNPGPAALVWFRVQYDDDSTRWLELPDPDEFVLRMPYQRRLALALQVGQSVGLDPRSQQPRSILNVYGRVYVSSFVRHVARIRAKEPPEGDPEAKTPKVKLVQVFKVDHLIMEPVEIRTGRDHYDLRNYGCWYLGSYDAQGVLQKSVMLQDWLVPFTQVEFGAQLLLKDVYPVLEVGGDLTVVELPPPIRKLLQDFTELRDPEIRRRLLLEAIGDPEAARMALDALGVSGDVQILGAAGVSGEIDNIHGSQKMRDAINDTPANRFHDFIRKNPRLEHVLQKLLEAKLVTIIDRHDKPTNMPSGLPPIALPTAPVEKARPQPKPGLKPPGKPGSQAGNTK